MSGHAPPQSTYGYGYGDSFSASSTGEPGTPSPMQPPVPGMQPPPLAQVESQQGMVGGLPPPPLQPPIAGYMPSPTSYAPPPPPAAGYGPPPPFPPYAQPQAYAGSHPVPPGSPPSTRQPPPIPAQFGSPVGATHTPYSPHSLPPRAGSYSAAWSAQHPGQAASPAAGVPLGAPAMRVTGLRPPLSAYPPVSEEMAVPPPEAPVSTETLAPPVQAAEEEEEKQPPQNQSMMFSSSTLLNNMDEASALQLPSGLLFRPTMSLDNAPPLLRRSASRCPTCSAYLNLYCSVDHGVWECVFCRTRVQNGELTGVGEDVYASHPELTKRVVDYLDPSKHVAQALLNGSQEPPLILVIDAHAPSHELMRLKESLSVVLSGISPNTRLGLVTFSNIVGVYEVGSLGTASALVFPGISSPTDEDLETIRGAIHQYIAPVHQCKENVCNIVEALASRAAHAASTVARGLEKRCLGAAVETALALADDMERGASGPVPSAAPIGGRILVCLTGAPSFGPGAVPTEEEAAHNPYHREKALQYFQALADRAAKAEIGIDILAAGFNHFHVSVLQNLVLSNGGVLVLNEDFGKLFCRNLDTVLSRVCGRHGSFELHTSSSIVVTRVIGPLQQAATGSDDVTTSRCTMGGVCSDACYTIYFEHAEDLVEDHVYFQAVISYINRQNQSVTRVITRRLETTGNMETFARSVHDKVLSLLVAKRSVLLARKVPDINDVHDDLDQQVKHIATKLGTRDKRKRLFVLPKELVDVARSLFMLRRGPLLSPLLQHPDDIDSLRVRFLHGDYEDSYRLLVPSLLVVKASGDFDEFPPETLALQSDKVLVMDHHADIYIWSGNETVGPEYDAIRDEALKFVEGASRKRFPAPHILQFKENSSEERWIKCRLIPSHKDSSDERLAFFPQLAAVDPHAMQALVSKFHRTDDVSYNEWYRSLFK